MSLHPHVVEPVPEETARVAHAAFPKGHPYLTFRDALGTIFQDEDFTALFPAWGQPGLPPWRLALVTILQFRENLGIDNLTAVSPNAYENLSHDFCENVDRKATKSQPFSMQSHKY